HGGGLVARRPGHRLPRRPVGGHQREGRDHPRAGGHPDDRAQRRGPLRPRRPQPPRGRAAGARPHRRRRHRPGRPPPAGGHGRRHGRPDRRGTHGDRADDLRRRPGPGRHRRARGEGARPPLPRHQHPGRHRAAAGEPQGAGAVRADVGPRQPRRVRARAALPPRRAAQGRHRRRGAQADGGPAHPHPAHAGGGAAVRWQPAEGGARALAHRRAPGADPRRAHPRRRHRRQVRDLPDHQRAGQPRRRRARGLLRPARGARHQRPRPGGARRADRRRARPVGGHGGGRHAARDGRRRRRGEERRHHGMTRTAPAGAPTTEPAERARPSFGQVWDRYGIIIVLLAMVALMAVIAPNFVSLSNGFNVARAVSINAVLAAGMTLVILTGGIDLSVGSIVGVAGVTSVLLWNAGSPALVAVLGGVLVGAAAGLLNGLLVAYLALPAFIVTLGALTYLRGTAYALTDGQPLIAEGELGFRLLGNGNIAAIPSPVVVMVITYVVIWFILERTTFGRHIYAVGGNVEAARLAGIKVRRVLLKVYLIAG